MMEYNRIHGPPGNEAVAPGQQSIREEAADHQLRDRGDPLTPRILLSPKRKHMNKMSNAVVMASLVLTLTSMSSWAGPPPNNDVSDETLGNTASGSRALANNITGIDNTAIGANALVSSTAGFNNTATGSQALESNTTGNKNTAMGSLALENNTRGAAPAARADRAASPKCAVAGDLSAAERNYHGALDAVGKRSSRRAAGQPLRRTGGKRQHTKLPSLASPFCC